MLIDRLKSAETALSSSPSVGRRGFLLGAAATAAGLAIGFRPLASSASDAAAVQDPFAAYLTIADDNTVTILSSQFDMGQGSYHGLATLVVEEMDLDWQQVTVVGASGNTALYGNLMWGGAVQGSGGSTSMATSWGRYRTAAATARRMLIEAAAESWSVPATDVTIEAGQLHHAASGRAAGLGSFARAAAGRAVPADVPLKQPADWKWIGNPDLKRYDVVPKTRGEQDFTIDVTLPGMLTATMIHPPKFGARVASVDAAEARSVPGVVDVVTVPSGVAIVASDMWSAMKARDLVVVTWDESEAETRGSEAILAEYRDLAAQAPVASARSEGDAAAAIASAATVIETQFEFPFLAHAALEPMNIVVRMTDDGILETWGGHQLPDIDRNVAAAIAGIEPAKVRTNVMKTGGGFGRRATPVADITAEAVHIAKAIGWQAPLRLQWTRENDMRGGFYRPVYVHRMRGALDADGNLVGWENHIVGQSIVAGTPFAGLIQDGVDKTSVEGASNLPYAIPNIAVGLTSTDVKIPVLWWRSVGHTHTAYTTEVFIDQLAEAAGADPVDFRLKLLANHPRHAAVLRLAAEKAGWGRDLPDGRRFGVAMHESFASYVAQVVEVSIEDGQPRVHRVVAAVDCGIAVNPDTIKAQIEGGIAFGLGSILQEELTLTDGEVDQGNYDTYTPLRIDQMPEVEVHIVASAEPPTGIGEPGVPPVAPAVANAVAAITGQRVTRLPFAKGLNV